MNKLCECPYCDKELTNKNIEKEMKYKGKIITIHMVGEYCEECDEIFQNDADATKNENSIVLAKNKADKIIAKDIARIRKSLNLSQAEASETFGGGIRAFYKYEKGEISPPQSLIILLDLLESKSTTIEDVKDSLFHKVA